MSDNILDKSHLKESSVKEIQRIIQGSPHLPGEKLLAYRNNLQDSLKVNENAQAYILLLDNCPDKLLEELVNLRGWYDDTYALLIQINDLIEEGEKKIPFQMKNWLDNCPWN